MIGSVIVATTADRVTSRTDQSENGADHDRDDAQCPDDWNAEEKSDEKENYSEDDHVNSQVVDERALRPDL
jgi:hypothetical protein